MDYEERRRQVNLLVDTGLDLGELVPKLYLGTYVSVKLCFSDLKVQLFRQLRSQVQLGNERWLDWALASVFEPLAYDLVKREDGYQGCGDADPQAESHGERLV